MEASSIQIFDAAEIPEAPFLGQMIFRSDTQVIQVFTGSGYQDAVGGVAGLYTFIGPTAPTAVNVGDLWFDSAHGNLPHRWDGTTWVEMQPGRVQTGTGSTNTIRIDEVNGLNAYGPTGAVVFSVDLAGNVTMLGTMKSGSKIYGTSFNTAPNDTTYPYMKMDSNALTWKDSSSAVAGGLDPFTKPFASGSRPGVRLSSGGASSLDVAYIDIMSGFTSFPSYINPQVRVGVEFFADDGLNCNSGYDLNGGGTIAGGPLIQGGMETNGQMQFNSLADGGSNNTNTGTKYVRCGSAGILWSSTTAPSSRDLKHDIAPLELDPQQILKLEPRVYRYNDDPDVLRAGFIAEEAHELGLTPWVGYEDATNPEKPTGFDYDGYVAALQLVIRNQEERLQRLEAQVAALTSTA